MIIYALFLCYQTTCNLTQPDRPVIYKTLADCESFAKLVAPIRSKDGRFRVSPDMWYECRGKHVDTWEKPR